MEGNYMAPGEVLMGLLNLVWLSQLLLCQKKVASIGKLPFLFFLSFCSSWHSLNQECSNTGWPSRIGLDPWTDLIAACICSQFVCPSIDVWILLSLPAHTISHCNSDVLWSWRLRVCVAGKKYTKGLAFPLKECMFPTLCCLLGGCITALLSSLCFNFLRSVINALVIQLAVASRFIITCPFAFLRVVFMHVVWSLVARSYSFFRAMTNHFSFQCEWWACRAV